MKTYLVWNHREKNLYGFESDKEELSDVAMAAANKMLDGWFENVDLEISISEDEGQTWSYFEYELCMHPSIYQTKCEPKAIDPRPKPMKL